MLQDSDKPKSGAGSICEEKSFVYKSSYGENKLSKAGATDPVCCGLPFFIGIMGVILFLDFTRHTLYMCELCLNTAFSVWFGICYALIMLLFVAALVLIIIYLFTE